MKSVICRFSNVIYRSVAATFISVIVSAAMAGPASGNQPFDPEQIAKFKAEGKWEKVVKEAKASGTLQFAPHLVEKFKKKIKKRVLESQGITTLEAMDFETQDVPPDRQGGLVSTGAPKIFVLLIEFKDHTHTVSAADINDMLFGNGDAAAFPLESLRNFYFRSSYGLLDLSNGTTLGWYKAGTAAGQPYNRSDVDETTQGRQDLIREALDYYASLGHDFSPYDNDGDGDIEYFIVLYAGPNCSPNCVGGDFWWGWYLSWTDGIYAIPYTVSGKRLSSFSWQWESNTPKTVIHETGHAMGLPDYYDYEPDIGPGGGLGSFDMMDHDGDHNCFSKWMLDWVDPRVVPGARQYLTLSDSSSVGACVLVWPGISPEGMFSEFYLVQNRQATGNDSNVSYLSSLDGLAIWHVDATLNGDGKNFLYNNSDTDHKLIRLMEADGLEEIETAYCDTNTGTCSTRPLYHCKDSLGNFVDWWCQQADPADFYTTGDVFAPNSMPSSVRYNGTHSCVRVWQITDVDPTPGAAIPATFSADCTDSTGSLTITPSDGLPSSGPEGGPFTPASQLYFLHNDGADSVNWTVNSNAATLGPGACLDTVSFTNLTNGNGNTSRAVDLTVNCVSVGLPDMDCDGDVDGLDLQVFAEELALGSNTLSVESFATNYGF